MVAKAVEAFGRLDFACNNAGVFLESAPITEVTLETIERTLGTNVRGVALCLKHEIPAILRAGGGGVVNTASYLGLRPSTGSAIYNASKAAVISLTKTAALEFAKQGVRVNAVLPGVVRNPDERGLPPGRARQRLSGRFAAGGSDRTPGGDCGGGALPVFTPRGFHHGHHPQR